MRCTVYLLPLFVLAACSGGGSSSPDAGPDAGDTDTVALTPLTAVDLLVVVDNSSGMEQEQSMLSQQMFELVGALMHPETGATYAAIDDIRIAAVTTNMGFSANGESMDDSWPYNVPSECSGLGDDGRFREIIVASVELPDGGVLDCPALANPWAETTGDAPNADLAAAAACLVSQGNSGCGWEQQLTAATRAVTREDQAVFVRDFAVLAVIAASDEEDCSMQDGQALFAEDEVTDQSELKLNIACGEHPEHLFPPSHFYDALTGLKPSAEAVVYAAIVGVPYAGQTGAAACQGPGDAITGCLDQEEMQLVPEESESGMWYFRRACTRSEGEVQVTDAWPGRRFVELATDFGANGYVYSICNEDWSPAFDALSTMIAGKLSAP